MALLVAVAGGLIGSIFGMPQLGFLAGSLLGSLLFSGSSRGGPKLKDLHVTSSTYGSVIPVGFGSARLGGNIIWSDQLKQHAHHQGKGLGGGASYTYSWTGAVGLCSTEFGIGPIQKVLKIWADTKLVYDATGQSGVTKNIPGSGGGKGGGGHHNAGSPVVNGNVTNAYNKLGHFRVYSGTQTQLPDPAAEALFGDANAQAHRGMAYIVFDDVDLENYGNRVPNWTFEVVFNNASGVPMSQNEFKFDFDNSVVSAPESDAVALDSFRQQAYFISRGANPGLHVMSLKTGDQVKAKLSSAIAPTRSLFDSGCIVGDDGYLWMWSSEANYGPWVKIDPDALVEVGHIGIANSFVSIDGATTNPGYVIPVKLNYSNCLFVVGSTFGDLTLLNLDTAKMISQGSYTDNGFKACGGNQISNTQAEIFGLGVPLIGGGTTSPLHTYSIIADALGGLTFSPTLLSTINPSDIDSDWVHFNDVSNMLFDATDGNFMFFVKTGDIVTTGHAKQYLVKCRGTDGSILWKMQYETTAGSSNALPGNPDYGSYQSIISSGVYSFIDDKHNVWTVSTQDGSFTFAAWDSSLSAGYAIWADPFGAILFHGTYTPSGGTENFSNSWGVIVTNSARNSRLLGEIVSEICQLVGFVPDDLDVSALTDQVEGYIMDSQMLARDALLPLGVAFLFDGVESDDVLKFVKRGGSSIVTIPATDLAYLDTKTNTLVQEARVQEVDLPNQVSLNFLDPNHNYQTATQYARRPSNPYPTMFSKNPRTENLPLVAEPGFMKQLAEKLLYTMWIERVSYKFHTPWNYLLYDPTDVVTLTLPDATQMISRLSTAQIGANMTVAWDALAQSTATYTSTAVADGGLGFNQQTLAPSTSSRLFLLDMPLLRDTDDTGQSFTILYDAGAGYGSSWAGEFVEKSADDINYSVQGTISNTQAVAWGAAINALGDVANPFVMDSVNTLTVNMVNGADTLASVTLLELCNGANAAALMDPLTGDIEIIQFMTVTVNGDGSLTFSNLLRGRRGTEVFTGSHPAGATFISLNTSTLQFMKMSLSDLNVARFFKAVTLGTLDASADPISFTDTGRPLKPYAPVHQTATLSGSDIDIAWVRRTRVGGELASYTAIVPLAEQFETYEVDIYNALGDTVLRTLRVEYGATPTTTPGVTYLAADIATDFGSTPTTLKVAVYQVSTVIGRGFGKLQTLTVM